MICNYKFQNRRRKNNLKKDLLNQYVWQRQTYSDLAKKYNKSNKWVQIKLDEVEIRNVVKLKPCSLVIVVDTTFFSRQSGLTVFREPNLKKNVWWMPVRYEKVDIYKAGRIHLEQNGFIVQAVVLDGKRGAREVFSDIPVQMCHFHQKQIIVRYITHNPKLKASQELKELVQTLANTNEKTFIEQLNNWHEEWVEFLKEKTINLETGKWFYTHKKVRSAYRSLKTNLPYLFTYQRYPEFKIPNTTNSLDGYFNVLKSKINVHRGLSIKRRMRIATEIIKGQNN